MLAYDLKMFKTLATMYFKMTIHVVCLYIAVARKVVPTHPVSLVAPILVSLIFIIL